MLQRIRSLCGGIALLALLLVPATSAVQAQEQDALSRGISLYRAANYADAKKCLEDALKTQPNSVQAHYCLAVCYRFTGQLADAAREFTWVCDNATMPDLYNRARLGLQSCNPSSTPAQAQSEPATTQDPNLIARYQQAMAALQKPVIAPSSLAPTQSGEAAPALRAPIEQASQAGSLPPVTNDVRGTGKPKIVDVWSESCVWCKKFEEYFDRARVEFAGRIDFASIDGETRKGYSFASRHNVGGVFPAIVFLNPDGSGVGAVPGCPDNYQEFVTIIHKAFPTLPAAAPPTAVGNPAPATPAATQQQTQ